MKRLVLASAAVLVLVVPAAAPAHSPQLAGRYLTAYHAVRSQFGPTEAGCNLLEQVGSCHIKATDGDLVKSLAVLERDLAPPPAPPAATKSGSYESPAPAPQPAVSTSTQPAVATNVGSYSSSPSSPTASSAAASSGAGGVPACASESGTNYSTGPANTNSSSGATGRYQITPDTAANYGCSLSTPAGQDACAQVIYQHQGAGAWVGCGG